jgi:hypothetical protein
MRKTSKSVAGVNVADGHGEEAETGSDQDEVQHLDAPCDGSIHLVVLGSVHHVIASRLEDVLL